MLKDTSAATSQAGIWTHILTTPEHESDALDRSATARHCRCRDIEVWTGRSFRHCQAYTFHRSIHSLLIFDLTFSLDTKTPQIMPFTREFPVKNNFQFTDIFNDTSVHLFPIDRLQEIPETIWDKHDEPMYDTDVESEIIPRQRNAESLWIERCS